MISKTIGYNGVHDIFRHTHIYNVRPPVDSVQLVQITPITRVHGIYNELVTGAYKLISWGPHIVVIYWLVVLNILKNMKVNGKDYPIYYGKCLKPATSI